MSRHDAGDGWILDANGELNSSTLGKYAIVAINVNEQHRRANAGSAIAQTILGACYLDGIDVSIDYQQAHRWLSAASRQGSSRATVNLARMYAEGLGVSKDMSEAIRLYEKAAERGEFLAQIELARIYSRGQDAPIDLPRAVGWYTAAVAQEPNLSDCVELDEGRSFLAANAP